MQLNLSDPDSIIAWWRVLPDRHDSYLAYKLKVGPEFAPAIREAQQRIASNPELAGRRAQADQSQQQHETRQTERTERLSAHALRHQEFAVV